jgi:hypothetical protein
VEIIQQANKKGSEKEKKTEQLQVIGKRNSRQIRQGRK